jgi:hypothetical protein
MIVIDVGAGVYRDKTVALHVKVSGQWRPHRRSDPRKMDVVQIPVFSNALDWGDVAGRVVDYARTLSNVTFVIDVGGQGEQFARVMEKLGCGNIVRVLWGNPPFLTKYKKRFFNLRAQCSVHAAEAVKDGRITFITDHSKDLLDQGSRIPYHFDEKARFHIMPKEKMKEDGLPSPDLWDTVCMAFIEGAHYITANESGIGNDERQKSTLEAMQAALEAQLAAMGEASA